MRKNSIAEQLSAAILALTHADARELEALAEVAHDPRGSETAEELRLATEKLRTLGALIAITRRNLRLLRGASGYRALSE
jgi:hypothetical protein